MVRFTVEDFMIARLPELLPGLPIRLTDIIIIIYLNDDVKNDVEDC